METINFMKTQARLFGLEKEVLNTFCKIRARKPNRSIEYAAIKAMLCWGI